jgi:hypothetical protein
MARLDRDEEGTALVETAIVVPCLVLVVLWSSALTDMLVLKLKAAEAARYALWESTVFKDPAQISAEVERRFSDLASPEDVRFPHTALLLYPRARDLRWRAEVDMASAEASLGGSSAPSAGGGPWESFVNALAGTFPRAVDAALGTMSFNTHGVALARVALAAEEGAGRRLLPGGDLPGARGRRDLAAPRSLRSLALQAPLPTQRPLRLVFDPWKAWPRPAPYAPPGASATVATSPSRTYPEVEKQVSAQLRRIAFFGVDRIPGFRQLDDFARLVLRSGVGEAAAGGKLPDIFSTSRMDDTSGGGGGPITILPPERAAESWVPQRCEIAGRDVPCPTQRAGDVTSASGTVLALDGDRSVGSGVDRLRYTLPYRIRSVYWRRYGGLDRELDSRALDPLEARLAGENAYVKSYRCRGHFFGGSSTAQSANRFGSCG